MTQNSTPRPTGRNSENRFSNIMAYVLTNNVEKNAKEDAICVPINRHYDTFINGAYQL